MARKKTQTPVVEDTQDETTPSVRPNTLAKELNVDPKRIRAFLRDKFTRSDEAKNTNWDLSEEQIKAVRERFAQPVEDSDEE